MSSDAIISDEIILKILRSDISLHYASRSICKSIRNLCISYMMRCELTLPIRDYEPYESHKDLNKNCYVVSSKHINYKDDLEEKRSVTIKLIEVGSSIKTFQGMKFGSRVYKYIDSDKYISAGPSISYERIEHDSYPYYSQDNYTKCYTFVDVESYIRILKYRCDNIFNIPISDRNLRVLSKQYNYSKLHKLSPIPLILFKCANLLSSGRIPNSQEESDIINRIQQLLTNTKV